MKKEFEIDIKLPEPIATVKFDVKFPGTYKVEVQPNGSWSVEAPVIGVYINPNDCGEIGGWDIPENEDIPSNVDGTEQATRPDDFCSWGGREEQMTLNEFVEELDIAIKQDGHDIYCNAETAKMLKSLINDGEKPKRLHKICTIYVTPPNDTKKVDELLKNTDFYIAIGYDDNGKFRYEVFEKDPLK